MTDQIDALNGQGDAEANPQGEPNNHQSMESLLESESLSVDLPQVGEIRKGMIASIGVSQILVSIGAKSEGVIAGRELEQLSEEERTALKVGHRPGKHFQRRINYRRLCIRPRGSRKPARNTLPSS